MGKQSKSLATDARALRYVKTFEDAGRPVERVVIKGREIHLVLNDKPEAPKLNDFDAVDMKR